MFLSVQDHVCACARALSFYYVHFLHDLILCLLSSHMMVTHTHTLSVIQPQAVCVRARVRPLVRSSELKPKSDGRSRVKPADGPDQDGKSVCSFHSKRLSSGGKSGFSLNSGVKIHHIISHLHNSSSPPPPPLPGRQTGW